MSGVCVTGLKRTSPVSPRYIDLLVALPDEAQRCTVRSSERIFSRQDLLRLMKRVSDCLNCLHGPLHRLACEHSTPEQRFDPVILITRNMHEQTSRCPGVMLITAKCSKSRFTDDLHG
jgi:hypothetical protein